jgi:hypothetical protein
MHFALKLNRFSIEKRWPDSNVIVLGDVDKRGWGHEPNIPENDEIILATQYSPGIDKDVKYFLAIVDGSNSDRERGLYTAHLVSSPEEAI